MKPVTAYERKKEPERVRRALLDATARLAAAHGMSSVTLDAVARAAGVTKGGLFHHFPSKHALLHGMFAEVLEYFDTVIDMFMAADHEPYGRFTRAYVEGVFADLDLAGDAPSGHLSVSMLADANLQLAWSQWLRNRLNDHVETDGNANRELVRLAADGVWLSVIAPERASSIDFDRARTSMLELTRSRASASRSAAAGPTCVR